MTNGLSRFMNYLASGRSQIFEKDHLLIIGWHGRMHSIVEELIRSEERVISRLGRSGLPAIVILTNEYRPELLVNLRQKLPEDIRGEARILVRSGNPLEAESLERVDFTRASAIILTSQVGAGTPRHFSDMTLVKTLMMLRAGAGEVPPEDLPNVVLDIAVSANKLLAESVGWHRTEAIASAEFMSRLLCQSIRHPGLSSVYLHLLTDTFGDSAFLVSADELGIEGQTLGEVVHAFERAIPIGFLKSLDSPFTKEERLRLLAFDEPVEAGDELVCVAPSLRAIEESFDAERPARLTRQLGALPPGEHALDTDRPVGPNPRRILLVGWSPFVRPLLDEFATYERESFEVTIVTEKPVNEVTGKLNSLDERHGNLELSVVRSALNTVDEVREIRAERFDNIALVSPEIFEDPLLADAETVMAFVLLDRYLRQTAPQREIAFLAELNDEDNQPLLRLNRPADVLITAEIVSHLLSQIAVRRSLAWVYEELFTHGGVEIDFRPFEDIVDLAQHPLLDFNRCQQACLQGGRIAIGYSFAAPRGPFSTGVHLNPERDVKIEPRHGDQLVVVEV
ncbi:MAG: CASTOR/POLLUX-related putative ion channel [Persicimonas sp.]